MLKYIKQEFRLVFDFKQNIWISSENYEEKENLEKIYKNSDEIDNNVYEFSVVKTDEYPT